MWIFGIYLKLFILVVLGVINTQADSSACEQKEKHLALLDFAKESISKAKDLQPACFKDSNDTSSNSSECGAKEKVSAYLDIAARLINDAKENYTNCDETRDLTKIVLLRKKPIDCSEVLENGENKSGEYEVWPRNRMFPGLKLRVYCDMDTDGGGWTVIQRRGNFSDKIDFYRNWKDYKDGFGNISEEFWIGNDNIFALTNQGNYDLRFDMENVTNDYRFATYSSFWIDNENAGYMVHFGNYSGTAGDGFTNSRNMKFLAKDKDDTKYLPSCTTLRMGGWWYSGCGSINPNGQNMPGIKPGKPQYMNWLPWLQYDSLLKIEIKIRAEN